MRSTRVSSPVAWLKSLRGSADWDAALDTLGDAPLLAAQSDPNMLVEFARETRSVLEEARGGRADPVATAERWARTDVALRLLCIENWLTDRIRGHFADPNFSVEVHAGVHLQRAAQVPSIGKLFTLTEVVQELKAALDAPINRALALESLLRQLAAG